MARKARTRVATIKPLLHKTLLIVALLGVTSCAAHDMSSSDADALYRKRFANLQTGNLAANYDPMEIIAGAPRAAPIPVADPAARTIRQSALDAARNYAAANRSTAFLVWRNGVLEAANYFDGTNRASEINSLSLAKPLSVIAVGRALMLGKIRSLDQPVAYYVHEWRHTPKAHITIREVLQMRSGLKPQATSRDPGNVLNTVYLHPFHGKILVDSYPLTDPPGSRYAYANANAELVAVLIERATGRRYAQFVSQQILAPLGALGGRVWIDRPGGLAHSGCCVQLPAETWLRLGILVLRDGNWNGRQLLSREYVAAMTTAMAQNPYVGMGVYVAGQYTKRRGFGGPGTGDPGVLHGEPYLAADLALFDGNADQVLYMVPSANLVALRVGSPPPKDPEWDNSTIPNILLRGIDWHGRPPPPQAVQ
jgi:CubicO group peptidase (beta-lactamase class C family)